MTPVGELIEVVSNATGKVISTSFNRTDEPREGAEASPLLLDCHVRISKVFVGPEAPEKLSYAYLKGLSGSEAGNPFDANTESGQHQAWAGGNAVDPQQSLYAELRNRLHLLASELPAFEELFNQLIFEAAKSLAATDDASAKAVAKKLKAFKQTQKKAHSTFSWQARMAHTLETYADVVVLAAKRKAASLGGG